MLSGSGDVCLLFYFPDANNTFFCSPSYQLSASKSVYTTFLLVLLGGKGRW